MVRIITLVLLTLMFAVSSSIAAPAICRKLETDLAACRSQLPITAPTRFITGAVNAETIIVLSITPGHASIDVDWFFPDGSPTAGARWSITSTTTTSSLLTLSITPYQPGDATGRIMVAALNGLFEYPIVVRTPAP